jgi:DNA polymerase III alpha subunit
MKTTQYSEQVYNEQDLFDFVMQGHDLATVSDLIIDPELDLEKLAQALDDPKLLATWHYPTDQNISIAEFDSKQQTQWFMPDSYCDMDIAEHVLSLCSTQEELQRCGEELLMFQERNLFDLLRYLKYFVDTMQENHMIWGVGRGSSVASYVLYKLGVHKIDSLHYDLDPEEFLR